MSTITRSWALFLFGLISGMPSSIFSRTFHHSSKILFLPSRLHNPVRLFTHNIFKRVVKGGYITFIAPAVKYPVIIKAQSYV